MDERAKQMAQQVSEGMQLVSASPQPAAHTPPPVVKPVGSAHINQPQPHATAVTSAPPAVGLYSDGLGTSSLAQPLPNAAPLRSLAGALHAPLANAAAAHSPPALPAPAAQPVAAPPCMASVLSVPAYLPAGHMAMHGGGLASHISDLLTCWRWSS